MDPIIGGSLISAGSSIIGGILGNSAEQDAINFQRMAMKRGIQWRVADAEKAGVHPLFALGANISQPAPTQIGSLGQGIAAAGQEIGRAVAARGTAGERAALAAQAKLQLQRLGLENELLATQIVKMRSPGTGPAMPSPGDTALIPGQAQTVVKSPTPLGAGIVRVNPKEQVSTMPSQPFSEAGQNPGNQYVRTTANRWMPVPSSGLKQAIEDSPYEIEHFARNRLMPALGLMNPPPPPPDALTGRKPNQEIVYIPETGEYEVRGKKRDYGPAHSRARYGRRWF